MFALTSLALAQWDGEDGGTKSSLRGIHNAGQGVAWASGTKGSVLRSEDDGYLWQQCAALPEWSKLDFRGAWGWGANHAMVMSSGPGAASRLYETVDGCAHWRLLLTNPESAGFWDAIAFRNQRQGVLLGDPVNGRFVILRTNDGGQHWSRDDSPGLEADPRGEGAFAASNSALALGTDEKSIYFATGGPAGSRVFRFHTEVTTNSGHWTAVKLPFSHNTDASGIFSLSFRDARHGVAIGGDYKQPDERKNTAAWTDDGGATWAMAATPPAGYRSAVAWDEKLQAWVAVGPNGSDISFDDGKTWKQFDKAGWNALSLPWAVGAAGKIAMLNEAMLRIHR